MSITIVKGAVKDGSYQFSDCNLNANEGRLTCGDDSFTTVCQGARCSIDVSQGTLVAEDIFQNETSYIIADLPPPRHVLLTRSTDKGFDTYPNTLRTQGFSFAVRFKFKKEYMDKDGAKLSGLFKEFKDYKEYEAWMGEHGANVDSQEIYCYGAPDNNAGQTKRIIRFDDGAELNKFVNSPRSFILIEGAETRRFAEYEGLKDYLAGKAGAAVNASLFVLSNVKEGQGVVTRILALKIENWDNLKSLAEVFSNEELLKSLGKYKTETGSDSKYRLRGYVYGGPLKWKWPEAYRYHQEAANILDDKYGTHLSTALPDPTATGDLNGGGFDAGFSYYPGQRLIGFGVDLSIGGASSILFLDSALRVEADPLAAIFGEDVPVSVIPYGGAGLLYFNGKTPDAQMYSRAEEASATAGFWRAGVEVPISLTGDGRWKLLPFFDYNKVFAGHLNQKRFGLDVLGKPDFWRAGLGLAYTFGTAKEEYVVTKAETGLAPNTIEPKTVVTEPKPLMPAKYELKKLSPITVRVQINFVVGRLTPVKGEAGEGKLQGLADEIARAVTEYYQKNNLPPPDKGSTIIVTVRGNASSEGKAALNMALSIGRANTVKTALYQQIKEKHDAGAEPFGALVVDQANFRSFGEGEEKPLAINLGEVIKKPFGGYENNANKKGNIFYLCLGSTDPKITKAACEKQGKTVIEEDMEASRNTVVEVTILPPGVTPAEPSIEELSAEQRAADADMGNKLAAYIQSSAWMRSKASKGLKSVSYNKDDNSINIVLDSHGYANMEALKAGLFKQVRDAAAKRGLVPSSACTIKFWLFDENPPSDYEARIRETFYKFGEWPFAGGIAVGSVKAAYDKKQAKEKIDASIEQKKKELEEVISSNSFRVGRFAVTAIPINDFGNMSRVESDTIKLAARLASASGQKVTLLFNYHGGVNEHVTTYISNIVRYIYPGLGDIVYHQSDSRLGNYVVLISGDKALDLTGTGDADIEALRKTIFEKINKLAAKFTLP